MLAATSSKALPGVQQSKDTSAVTATQGALSVPQQRLHKIKAMLMRQKPELQSSVESLSHSGKQQSQQVPTAVPSTSVLQQNNDTDLFLSQQQIQQEPKPPDSNTPTRSTPQNPLSRLSASLQYLQAKLTSRELLQQQPREQLASDVQAHVQPLNSNSTMHGEGPQPAPQRELQGIQKADLSTSTETDHGVTLAQSSLQKLARLPWLRPSVAAPVMQQPESKHIGSAAKLSNIDSAKRADSTVASAAPEADIGLPLDAAVQQPASLLRSWSEKLPFFSRQAPTSPAADPVKQGRSTLVSATPKATSPEVPTAELPTSLTAKDGSAAAAEPTGESVQQSSPTWRRLGSQLGLQINSAVQITSGRVRALTAWLPTYPTYVHIGSHQILLPASPALTQAVESAQQPGPAEQQRQALMMHSMAAYRGRALAICRSEECSIIVMTCNRVTSECHLILFIPAYRVATILAVLCAMTWFLAYLKSRMQCIANTSTLHWLVHTCTHSQC